MMSSSSSTISCLVMSTSVHCSMYGPPRFGFVCLSFVVCGWQGFNRMDGIQIESVSYFGTNLFPSKLIGCHSGGGGGFVEVSFHLPFFNYCCSSSSSLCRLISTVQPLWYPIPPLLHLLRGDNSVSLISVTIFGFVSIMIGQEAHFSVAANHGLLNSNAVNVPGDPDRQRYLMSTKASPNTIILSLKRAVKRG